MGWYRENSIFNRTFGDFAVVLTSSIACQESMKSSLDACNNIRSSRPIHRVAYRSFHDLLLLGMDSVLGTLCLEHV